MFFAVLPLLIRDTQIYCIDMQPFIDHVVHCIQKLCLLLGSDMSNDY